MARHWCRYREAVIQSRPAVQLAARGDALLCSQNRNQAVAPDRDRPPTVDSANLVSVSSRLTWYQ